MLLFIYKKHFHFLLKLQQWRRRPTVDPEAVEKDRNEALAQQAKHLHGYLSVYGFLCVLPWRRFAGAGSVSELEYRSWGNVAGWCWAVVVFGNQPSVDSSYTASPALNWGGYGDAPTHTHSFIFTDRQKTHTSAAWKSDFQYWWSTMTSPKLSINMTRQSLQRDSYRRCSCTCLRPENMKASDGSTAISTSCTRAVLFSMW